LLWCDNDSCENSDGEPGSDLHTSFELNRLSEYVELLDPDGNVADSVCLQLQARNTSVGRFPDGVDAERVLEPTPGGSNKAPGASPDMVRCGEVEAMLHLDPTPPCAAFFRGDAQADCRIDITDAVFILTWLFLGGKVPTCQDAADANDTGAIDLTDAIYILGYLFLGGPPPPAPPFPEGREQGYDTTWDRLPACVSVSCH
jgi:hypothetical protein